MSLHVRASIEIVPTGSAAMDIVLDEYEVDDSDDDSSIDIILDHSVSPKDMTPVTTTEKSEAVPARATLTDTLEEAVPVSNSNILAVSQLLTIYQGSAEDYFQHSFPALVRSAPHEPAEPIEDFHVLEGSDENVFLVDKSGDESVADVSEDQSAAPVSSVGITSYADIPASPSERSGFMVQGASAFADDIVEIASNDPDIGSVSSEELELDEPGEEGLVDNAAHVTVAGTAVHAPPVEDPSLKVIIRFESIAQYKTIHKAAAEFEDALETKEIDDINKGEASFKAWPIIKVPHTNDVELWVILIESKPSIDNRVPSIGEYCQLRAVNEETGKLSAWWSAKRIPNNFASDDSKKDWAKLLAFNVTLVKSEDDSNTVMQALVPDMGDHRTALAELELTDENAIGVGFFFTKSDATFDAEMMSLSKLVKAAAVMDGPPTPPTLPSDDPDKAKNAKAWLELSERLKSGNGAVQPLQTLGAVRPLSKKSQGGRQKGKAAAEAPRAETTSVKPQQVAAFKYLVSFGEPEFYKSIFHFYPHMIKPDMPCKKIPEAIIKKYRRMDADQRAAYERLLSKMPSGIAMLPGGPGGGKTDWAMTVVGLMQSKSRAKVLYLLDINDPLDDATGKYVGMMKNANLNKRAIRMRTFGTELKKSVRVDSVQRRARKDIVIENSDEPEVDFSRNFLPLYEKYVDGTPLTPSQTHHLHAIPTLDESAWDYYESNKKQFQDLTDLLETCNNSAVQNRALRNEIFNLYSAVLHRADFIATTPCVAGSAFRRMFKPDLVVFDEAAHARELSTLISIANFCPKAGWIFIGDHRQTQPTVKSNGTNPHGQQLAMSAMERAFKAGVLKHQLLINHRAYGKLERLASKLIYDGAMQSAIHYQHRFPRIAKFVLKYMESLAGMSCNVPRLVVHLDNVGRAEEMGTSWYHPEHINWTMQRVLELVRDQRFRSAENEWNQGTILILSPYKAAVNKYQEAIDELAQKYSSLRIHQRVEARTWDSAQGHEADIVAIDYVRSHPTDFMDGMYRFNVGLTRARQGEWHLMHPRMPGTHKFCNTKYLRRMYMACQSGVDGVGEGRIVHINWPEKAQLVPRVPRAPRAPASVRPVQATQDRGVGENSSRGRSDDKENRPRMVREPAEPAERAERAEPTPESMVSKGLGTGAGSAGAPKAWW